MEIKQKEEISVVLISSFCIFMNTRFISYSASKKTIYRCAAPTFFFSMLFYKDFGALHMNN